MPQTARRTAVTGLALVLGLGLAGQAPAQTLPTPEGPVILTVTGSIGCTNRERAAEFDRKMLQAMDPVTLRTSTLWNDGVQTFTGVRLKTLLERVCATGSQIDAWALNDYWAEIPVTDAVEDGPILAYEQNGKALTVRDKGPLWIIYPYDANPDYQTEVIYTRSVWQLVRLELRD